MTQDFGIDASSLLASVAQAPPPKSYRIGEVVKHSGFSRQTIHNYTTMGLINASSWTDGGHRLYDEGVFRRLAVIASLKDRYSLREIMRIFEQTVEHI